MSLTAVAQDTNVPLAELVRERTRALHDLAESSGVMGELLGESVPLRTHIETLSQLLFVYRALEDGADALRTTSSDIDILLDVALYRTAAIEADLTRLLGSSDVPALNPETAEYVADIEQTVTQHNTPGFLAHHYTRYLGDLSGGLVIGHNIRRRTGLGADGGAGVRFYEFDQIPHPKAYKDGYRNRLNALNWSAGQREEFCAGAERAYLLNDGLFGGIVARRTVGRR